MQGYGRYSVSRRLLAATLSLVLVLASMVGAYAHAAHGAQHDDHGVHAAFDEAPDTATVGSADDENATDRPISDAKHASCGDLLCHGGFAILNGQVDRQHHYERSLTLIHRNDTKYGSSQSSLDRPPRLSVLV